MLCDSCFGAVKYLCQFGQSGGFYDSDISLPQLPPIPCCWICEDIQRTGLEYFCLPTDGTRRRVPAKYQLEGISTSKKSEALEFPTVELKLAIDLPSTHELTTRTIVKISRRRFDAALNQHIKHISNVPNLDPNILTHWISECRTKHAACQVGTTAWRPTRLIFVGGKDEDVKLVVTENVPPIPDYITLSHRWPMTGQKFPTLNRFNLDEFQQHIEVTSLQKTFQEAIEMTRLLSFQYLWIDSLCIRQDEDDISDWQQESLLMDKVYMNASLNISATGLPDSTWSLMRARCPQYTVPSQFFDNDGMVCSIDREDYWEDQVTKGPLSSRGWVLQERLLSKRVLHLGGNQIAWECRELQATEGSPTGVKLLGNYTLWAHKAHLYATLQQHQFHFGQWKQIVEDYSGRDLTRRSDILRAIDGVANYFAKATRFEYLSGMWRPTIALELPWARVLENDRRSKPATSVSPYAPSWSWASIRGKVRYVGSPTVYLLGANPETLLVYHKDVTYSVDYHMTYNDVRVNFDTYTATEYMIDVEDGRNERTEGGHTICRTLYLKCFLSVLQFDTIHQDGILDGITINGHSFDQLLLVSGQIEVDCAMPDPKWQDLSKSQDLFFLPTVCDPTGLAGIIIVQRRPQRTYRRIGALSMRRFIGPEAGLTIRLRHDDGLIYDVPIGSGPQRVISEISDEVQQVIRLLVEGSTFLSARTSPFSPVACEGFDPGQGRYLIQVD